MTALEERAMPSTYVTVANIANAAEPGTTGTFRFSRTGSTSGSLIANIAVTGTATSGTDYTSIGTFVTFPANAATVDVNVSAIDDSIYESTETVIVTVQTTSKTILAGSPAVATVTIVDNETNAAPQIINFTATNLGNGQYLFTGQVVDESPGGLTITFGGVPTMVGLTTTTASDGTFSKMVQLQTNGSDDGTVTASTIDIWGSGSNVALVNVTP